MNTKLRFFTNIHPRSFATPLHPDSGTVREDTHPQGDRYLHAPLRQNDSAKCGKAEWSHRGVAGVQKTGNGKQNALHTAAACFRKVKGHRRILR